MIYICYTRDKWYKLKVSLLKILSLPLLTKLSLGYNDRMNLKSREVQANFQEADLAGRISNLLIKIPRLAE